MASQARLDALAQQMGYKNFAVYQAVQRNRNAMIGAGTNGATGIAPPPGPAPAPAPASLHAEPQNWLQMILGYVPGARLLGYTNDQYSKATKR